VLQLGGARQGDLQAVDIERFAGKIASCAEDIRYYIGCPGVAVR